jgi:hypothetical protein
MNIKYKYIGIYYKQWYNIYIIGQPLGWLLLYLNEKVNKIKENKYIRLKIY